VNQLHEEPDEAHDGETDGGRDRNLLEFCENKIKIFILSNIVSTLKRGLLTKLCFTDTVVTYNQKLYQGSG
jgi:hypothetical protein